MYFGYSKIWGLGEYCQTQQKKFFDLGMLGRREAAPNCDDNGEPDKKRQKIDENIFHRNVAFIRTNYDSHGKTLPKSILHSHALSLGDDYPVYETQQEDKLFRTICTFKGGKYMSSYWEKNKKFAEQGAALVCLIGLEMVKEEDLVNNGSMMS